MELGKEHKLLFTVFKRKHDQDRAKVSFFLIRNQYIFSKFENL